jgi:hypothetical protein
MDRTQLCKVALLHLRAALIAAIFLQHAANESDAPGVGCTVVPEDEAVALPRHGRLRSRVTEVARLGNRFAVPVYGENLFSSLSGFNERTHEYLHQV